MNMMVNDQSGRQDLYSILQASTMQPWSPSAKAFVDTAPDVLVTAAWSKDPNHAGLGIVLFPNLPQPATFGQYLAVAHDPTTKAVIGQPVPISPMSITSAPTINIGVINLG